MGFIFERTQTHRGGMLKGGPVAHRHRRNSDSIAGNDGARLRHILPAVGHGVQHDRGCLAAQLYQFQCRPQRIEIEDGGPAGDKDAVGHPDRRQGGVANGRRSIDEYPTGPGVQLLKELRQARRLRRDDNRRLSLAPVSPVRRRRLRVEIDDRHLGP
jgi:hypothetical protein